MLLIQGTHKTPVGSPDTNEGLEGSHWFPAPILQCGSGARKGDRKSTLSSFIANYSSAGEGRDNEQDFEEKSALDFKALLIL